MPASSIEITVDAVDQETAAAFWAAALGYERRYTREPYVVLGPPEPDGRPVVLIQRVPELAAGKTPLHLDLRVPHPAAEVRRLVELGARVEAEVAEAGHSWTVLTDPQGVHFCICPERGGE